MLKIRIFAYQMVLNYFKENNGILKLIGLFALLLIIIKLIYGEREQEEPNSAPKDHAGTLEGEETMEGRPNGSYDPVIPFFT